MSQQVLEQKQEEVVVLKKKRKWPIILSVMLAAAILFAVFGDRFQTSHQVIISPTETSKLVRTDLQDSISATGMVESANSMTVYSTMAYTVQDVVVKVGDHVEEGQLLCKLDDQKIQDQIQTQQAGLDASTSVSNASIAAARDTYNQFKNNLDNGLNTSIISAENALTNAYNAYINAQSNYDRYLAGLQAGENTTILSQDAALRNARINAENAYDAKTAAEDALEDAEDALEDLEEAFHSARKDLQDAEETLDDIESELYALQRTERSLTAEHSELEQQIAVSTDPTAQATLQAELQTVAGKLSQVASQIVQARTQIAEAEAAYRTAENLYKQSEKAVESGEAACDAAEAQIETCEKNIVNAQDAFNTAQKQYQAAMTSVDNTLADYSKNVETAFEAYQTAQTSLDAAKASAKNQLQTYKNNLSTAYANAGKGTAEVALEQLRADLAGTEITAPMAGTVTAVYAEVGASGSGLLFVIEDTENFVVTTSLKDYDIASVSEGTPVIIRSDAINDEEYEGKISYIAPTATKNALGATDTSGDITFAADVDVTSKETRLRIGLNVRMDLIIAQEKDVLSVPYDVIYQNEEGKDCMLVVQVQEDGSCILREQPVEIGLETDLDIAVQADGLMEGMTVVSSPEKYLQYIDQTVIIGAANAKSVFALSQEMMGGS